MIFKGLAKLNKTDQIAAMNTLQRAVAGVGVEDLFSEGDTNLDFPTLAANAVEADKAAAQDITNPRLRHEARWALAVYRDALYIHAGRRQAMGLGLHNALRAMYEGGKIAHDSGK